MAILRWLGLAVLVLLPALASAQEGAELGELLEAPPQRPGAAALEGLAHFLNR